MDYTLSNEQVMFAEAARTLFSDTCGPGKLRELEETGAARDQERWRHIAESGFPLILVPEALDGLGLAELDFALVAEQAGYAGLPEPLVESAGIAAPMLAKARPDAEVLRRSAATLAIQHWVQPFTADADTADKLLLCHGSELHLVDPADVELTRQESIDPFRRLFAVKWTPSAATKIAEGPQLWFEALDRGAVFSAAQGIGIAQRAIDMAVHYAKEREQFGKPIGSYQAVKHHLASAQVAVEFARPVVYAAAAVCGRNDSFSRARVSHAKIMALGAAEQATRASVQVHGAMGYSWEVDVHYFLKRALALTYAWGDPAYHRARIAMRLREQPVGPDQTFAKEREIA
jgi:alkylation response protein AidB-like acyl-CoA dehydrogenase